MHDKTSDLLALFVFYCITLAILWVYLFQYVIPALPWLFRCGGVICAPFIVMIVWGYIVLHFFEKIVDKKDGKV